jgi:hypothetical protein
VWTVRAAIAGVAATAAPGTSVHDHHEQYTTVSPTALVYFSAGEDHRDGR